MLPLGYSFNLDGSMVYQAFAALFIAQAYGIEMSIGQQVTLLLVMMLSSKGIAGVPRASLVVVAAVLPMFGLPEAGLLLIMGIDQFLDMGRTATNVIGNSIATAVVAKWEGALGTARARGSGCRDRRAARDVFRMKAIARALVAAALGCAVWPTSGAAPGWPDALSGRVQHIKETRTVRLGYRENAIPFSYLGPDAKPVGYSLDLCQSVVGTIEADLGVPLDIEFVRVTAQDRIARVLSGDVDLECGATTNTAQRRQQVAFSPVMFVTGTRLAVPAGSRVRDVNDLRGRAVAVVRGTTNETAMREVDRLRGLGVIFVAADDYRDALAMLTDGKAEALAADEVLLRGLLAETGERATFVSSARCCRSSPTGSCIRATTPRSATPSTARCARSRRTVRSSGSTTAGSCGRCLRASVWTCRWVSSSGVRWSS